jgi:hypothetical protein
MTVFHSGHGLLNSAPRIVLGGSRMIERRAWKASLAGLGALSVAVFRAMAERATRRGELEA